MALQLGLDPRESSIVDWDGDSLSQTQTPVPSLRRCTIISVSPDLFVILRVSSHFAKPSPPFATLRFLLSSFLLTLKAPLTATGYPLTHELHSKGGDSLALIRTNTGNDRLGEVK